MKKLITVLLIANLSVAWASAQVKPSFEKPKIGETQGRPKFIKKDFPRHWGKPPEIQVRDYVDLPKDFGKGSSTLANWIKENLKEDSIKKPEILTDREKLDPRKYESEVMGAVKEGSITRDEAQKKLGALREEMEKKGEFKRPKRPQKPELSDSVKESISNIKSQQEALHRSMKIKLAISAKTHPRRICVMQLKHSRRKIRKNLMPSRKQMRQFVKVLKLPDPRNLNVLNLPQN